MGKLRSHSHHHADVGDAAALLGGCLANQTSQTVQAGTLMDRPTLVLFTKAPLPGRVKIRFLPHTTAEIAATIAFEMIEDTVSIASACWPGPVRLLVSPSSDHTQLTEMAVRYNVNVGTQSQGDLGQKMQSAICDGLETSTAVAIMGCDIPSVTASILGYAFESLSNGANVV